MKTKHWGIVLAAAAVPLALAGPAATAATAPEPAAQTAQAEQQAFTAIEDRYWNDAALRELLGEPVDSEQNAEKFNYQQYQHGWMFQNLGDGAVTAIQGDIAARYTELGGAPELGAATTDELVAPDGVGRYNHFTGGSVHPSIYWTPDTGAQAVWGPVRDFWESKGWEVGYLGYPTKSTSTTADGAGAYNHFVGPDGAGASVYWSDESGAHSVQGDIRDVWAGQGWETGTLGYPTTDELVVADGVGRYNEFAGTGGEPGAAYWSPDSGAHWLAGPILERWDQLDGQAGYLGYPTSDPHEVEGGTQVDFQRGYVVLDESTGEVTDAPW
ncbi:hypothetical protein OOZ19_19750 [Saccharopolyspora sp. NFXS83]|uniref:LGFP repeat-containing protein n=1 Tax=Saccharopolyspora sp. NFXS83 TaxID=2993560 RepID=UPI00224ACD1B|nr:hypothetical protein [Saccharopolyspora sp. NFXS83]MCX2732481.1 hypothetical protein [Saccharopolyspora sp. NFXS83]